ncbi:MAG: bifunctional phosphoglucose/phosphomannose isomerase [Acidobacteriota bacterium]|nr:MAG: bifunctional phosphoglucose/phosphomannose isomerase [Acidobacteriota bacterium]
MLDKSETIQDLDRGGILEIMGQFDRHLEAAAGLAEGLSLGEVPADTRNVVLLGMGGSAIGGDLAKAYLGPRLTLPLEVVRSYSLPGHVGKGTLVIVSSYSGNTEETLSAFAAARRTSASVVAITSGGEVEELARKHQFACLKLPGGQPPRTALPFSFVGILGVLEKSGLVSGAIREVRQSIPWVSERLRLYGPEQMESENPAKQLARQLHGRISVVYGSEGRLAYVARRWSGQFCENGKGLSYFSALPEMNHNEIVGWKHPEETLADILPIFLSDRDDERRVAIRATITRELLKQWTDPILEFRAEGNSWLERLWTLILLGDFASVYLALLNSEDPTPVEPIEQLKNRLKDF